MIGGIKNWFKNLFKEGQYDIFATMGVQTLLFLLTGRKNDSGEDLAGVVKVFADEAFKGESAVDAVGLLKDAKSSARHNFEKAYRRLEDDPTSSSLTPDKFERAFGQLLRAYRNHNDASAEVLFRKIEKEWKDEKRKRNGSEIITEPLPQPKTLGKTGDELFVEFLDTFDGDNNSDEQVERILQYAEMIDKASSFGAVVEQVMSAIKELPWGSFLAHARTFLRAVGATMVVMIALMLGAFGASILTKPFWAFVFAALAMVPFRALLRFRDIFIREDPAAERTARNQNAMHFALFLLMVIGFGSNATLIGVGGLFFMVFMYGTGRFTRTALTIILVIIAWTLAPVIFWEVDERVGNVEKRAPQSHIIQNIKGFFGSEDAEKDSDNNEEVQAEVLACYPTKVAGAVKENCTRVTNLDQSNPYRISFKHNGANFVGTVSEADPGRGGILLEGTWTKNNHSGTWILAGATPDSDLFGNLFSGDESRVFRFIRNVKS